MLAKESLHEHKSKIVISYAVIRSYLCSILSSKLDYKHRRFFLYNLPVSYRKSGKERYALHCFFKLGCVVYVDLKLCIFLEKNRGNPQNKNHQNP